MLVDAWCCGIAATFPCGPASIQTMHTIAHKAPLSLLYACPMRGHVGLCICHRHRHNFISHGRSVHSNLEQNAFVWKFF